MTDVVEDIWDFSEDAFKWIKDNWKLIVIALIALELLPVLKDMTGGGS